MLCFQACLLVILQWVEHLKHSALFTLVLLDVFRAGEFTTSLATTVHSVVCIFACEFSFYDYKSLHS